MKKARSLRAQRSNLFDLRDCFVALLLAMTCMAANSQDTINFKAFDSLKTSAEDNHKVTASSKIDTILIFKILADTVSLDYLLEDPMEETNRLVLFKKWYEGQFNCMQNPYDDFKKYLIDKHGNIDSVLLTSYSRIYGNHSTQLYKLYSQSNKLQKDPDNWDVRLFRTINNNRSLFKDRFFNTFDRSMLPVSLLLPASMLIYSRGYSKTYDENSAYLLTAAEFTNMMLTFGTKLFVKRQRPINSLPHCYSKGEPLLDLYSFPSGHTSTTFSIATMFALRYPSYPQVYAPMYAWALIVAYGRPYFGMHYPSDLIAGALYGTGSSILIFSLRKELLKLKNSVLNEDKKDEGSIQAGVVSFFVGSFIASSIFNNLILKPKDGKRLFISPWMDNKRSGVNLNYRF